MLHVLAGDTQQMGRQVALRVQLAMLMLTVTQQLSVCNAQRALTQRRWLLHVLPVQLVGTMMMHRAVAAL